MNIPTFHLPFDVPAYSRYVTSIISSFVMGMGFKHWIQFKRKNRRHKIRVVNLKKLRAFLSEERPPFPIYCELAQREIFGSHGYYIKIPSIFEGGPVTPLSIYSRQTIPTGYYQCECRSDCLLFILLEDGGRSMTPHRSRHSFALLNE